VQHEVVSPTNTVYAFLFSTTRPLCLSHESFLDLFKFNKISCNLQSSSCVIRKISKLLYLSCKQIFSCVLNIQALAIYVFTSQSQTQFHTHTLQLAKLFLLLLSFALTLRILHFYALWNWNKLTTVNNTYYLYTIHHDRYNIILSL